MNTKIVLDLKNNMLGSLQYLPVDGKFPDWRRVVPDELSGEVGQFDPELVQKGSKFYSALKAKNTPEIMHNGKNAAIMTTELDYALFLIMPFRRTDRAKSYVNATSWAKGV